MFRDSISLNMHFWGPNSNPECCLQPCGCPETSDLPLLETGCWTRWLCSLTQQASLLATRRMGPPCSEAAYLGVTWGQTIGKNFCLHSLLLGLLRTIWQQDAGLDRTLEKRTLENWAGGIGVKQVFLNSGSGLSSKS